MSRKNSLPCQIRFEVFPTFFKAVPTEGLYLPPFYYRGTGRWGCSLFLPLLLTAYEECTDLFLIALTFMIPGYVERSTIRTCDHRRECRPLFGPEPGKEELSFRFAIAS
ncbi:hypothetical protein AVEN_83077-1 [Araneus ventricosus]|uniref:Uncharacterized protein n=1 Tax=Araneus ventricosus TaxID=182803 RepID=A0A4Y2AP32_ARAVE|nr:hypothetical protein AVEN_83077-1 [Araneus ventricosus]